jgi:adenosine deaminase
MRQECIQKKKNGVKKDISKSYNQFKEFEGKKYTGMKVGRTHKWYYDKGEWKEKK